MGIPRLMTHLQPYASPVKIQRTPNSQNNHNNIINDPSTATAQSTPSPASTPNAIRDENSDTNRVFSIIIDGPAFAYHIYHLCKSHLYYRFARARAEARKARRAKEKTNQREWGNGNGDAAGGGDGRVNQRQQQQQKKQKRGMMVYSSGDSGDDDASLSALDVVPSYALLNAMARYWLGVLEESVGVETVIAIIFDGALPASKQDVRRARLQDCVDQLLSFRSSTAAWSECPNAARNRNEGPNDELHGRRKDQYLQPPHQDSNFEFDLGTLTVKLLPAKLNALPAPPFLVSAIAEGLLRDKNSKYNNVTYFVPGEADSFCAALAREQVGLAGHGRPLVLTSDSDLLVYDLIGGNSGIEINSSRSTKSIHTAVVMFFRSISFIKSDNENTTALKGFQFSPSEISSRLDVQSLVKIAFAISQRPGSSFQENVNYAKNLCNDSAAFSAFAEPYMASRSLPSTRDFRCKPICGLSIQALDNEDIVTDARISELFYQKLTLEQHCPQGKAMNQESDSILKMYLPFLHEDPQRSSAWDCGEHIRAVAYSIIGTRNYKGIQVIEHCRCGARIVEKAGRSLSVDQAVLSLREIAESMRDWRDSFAMLSDSFRSRLHGIYTVCKFLLRNQRPIPSEEEIRSIFHGQFLEKSWRFLHLSAQVQASLYSLRLLLQVLEIRLHLLKHLHIENHMTLSINIMRDAAKELKYLPTLESVFSVDSDNNEDKWCFVRNEFYRMLGCKETPVTEQPNTESQLTDHNPDTDIYSVHPSIKIVNAYDLLSIQ